MLVNPSPDQKPPEPRSSLRMGARLDATTREKVDDLATRFHQPRAAVLSHIMHWGLSYRHTSMLDQGESRGPVHYFYLYIESKLHEQVRKAAVATGVKTAHWLRHMVRQITITDFPASWQEARAEARSHDSRRYGTRFMLRLDAPSQTTLQQLVKPCGASQAAIIRQLIAHATPDAFPQSWHARAAACRVQQSKHQGPDSRSR
jgi:hypothetical protein